MAKVMLVEDDNNLREIYGARLQAEGHDIVAAKDGEEALALAVKEKPDLIISDVMMPRISGFDMLDILRNAPETKDTKVIMMTALSQAEDKARADKLGADRYLVKSQVTLEDVANVVREVLEGTPEGGSVTAEHAAEASAEPAPAVTSAPSVEAIANPVIEVHDEPDPSQVQAPPSEEIQPQSTPASEPVAAPVVSETPAPVAEVPPSDPVPAATPTADPVAETPTIVDPATPVVTPAEPPTSDPAANDSSQPTAATDLPVAAPPSDPVPAATPTADPVAETLEAAAQALTDSPAPAEPTIPAMEAPEATPPAAAEPAPIKVELPKIDEVPAEQSTPEVPAPDAPPSTPVATTPEETNTDSFVGPNLAEALALEEEGPKANSDEAESTSSVDDMPVPVVSNGTPATIVVEPTLPIVQEPEPTPDEDSGVSTAASANTAAGMRVIHPINDPSSAQPDINELLAAEERKAAVENPVANTVITPGKTASDSDETASANPQPEKPDDNNPVNNIAL